MRVGIDLDGVCYDFTEGLRTYLVQHHGYDPAHLTDSYTWDHFMEPREAGGWGITREEFLDFCHGGVDADHLFRIGEPTEGCREALEEIRDEGHSIHVVTSRWFGSKSAANTEGWLLEHRIPHNSLTLAKDKTIVNVDILLDDFADNYRALDAAGMHVVYYDQPWNQGEPGRRVHSWPEFVEYVKKLNAEMEAMRV